ncbi:MAG: formate/nitrite transporter family protein [Terriglobales bacterium]
MDYVTPAEVIAESVQLARKKTGLSVGSMLLRGILAGAFLGYATSLSITVGTQGLPPIAGAILFPVGFVMLVLLGLELATGNFALLPLGVMAKTVRGSELARNWTWVYFGNLIGSVLYAALFFLAITNCGTNDGGSVAVQVRLIAQKKTLAYLAGGGSGWATAFIRAILCNWMVTVGTLLALVSRSTIGKIGAMWLPILMFFALGYEHSIVNMFVIPAGMFLGAPVTLRQWWLWNQVPVTLGNVVGGVVCTGVALYAAHAGQPTKAASAQAAASAVEPVLTQQPELAS